jgi:Ran GTPase-activating protein (RanGAP) involved in mRNA processing and transport
LGWNNLGLKGAKALAEGLKYSSTLQQLYVAWSGITDAGASHIAKALEGNSSVQLLDMSGCHVSAATCLVLVETLGVNKTLERLVLQDNPLGMQGTRRLLRAVHAGGCTTAGPQACQGKRQLAMVKGVMQVSLQLQEI